jgi:hypothetical protein
VFVHRIAQPNQRWPLLSRVERKGDERNGAMEPDHVAVVGHARVVKEYASRSGDGLVLRVGDVVEILSRHESGWWLGRCNGKQGVFPCSRVTEEEDGSVPPQKVCVALHDFSAQEEDELSFVKGEVITIVAKSKSGWWKGRIGPREGIFPANRVREEGVAAGQERWRCASLCCSAFPARIAEEQPVKVSNPSRAGQAPKISMNMVKSEEPR